MPCLFTSEVQVESVCQAACTCTIYKFYQKCHHFKNLPGAIKSLKAATNNSRKIDPSNWLTLLINDWGYSSWQNMPSLTKQTRIKISQSNHKKITSTQYFYTIFTVFSYCFYTILCYFYAVLYYITVCHFQIILKLFSYIYIVFDIFFSYMIHFNF